MFRLQNRLIDGAEDRLARFVEHLDTHAVAELHELGLRLAVLDGLQTPLLGEIQQYPRDAPLLEIVPHPTMLPARRLRVFDACAMSWPKWNTMSVP